MSKNTNSIQRRIAVISGKLAALEQKKKRKQGNRHSINWAISAKKGLLAHLCHLYLLKGETNE